MPQDDYGAIRFRDLKQRLAHETPSFFLLQRGVRTRLSCHERLQRSEGLAVHDVERCFLSALESAQFVITKVQSDPPKKRRDPSVGLVLLPFREQTGERF